MEDLNKDLDTNKLEQNSEILTEDSHRDQNAAEASGNEVMEDQPDTSAKQGPEAEIEKWQKESADWKDKYVRLYAEFENFRQRTSKEKLNLISTATEGLMLELLPVIDDFERSIKAMESAQDVASLKEGVDLVFHKFSKTLHQKGLKPMEAIGKPFDADFHEAITQIPSPTPEQKGTVIDEIEKGYILNEKTIRFAKVVIGA